MRILFFLEPVIFRQTPLMITAHLKWVSYFKRALTAPTDALALAANPLVCEKWRELNGGDDSLACFPIDAFEPLYSFHCKRTDYMKALYDDGKAGNALSEALRKIRQSFTPDLVVLTTQNAFVQHVFEEFPLLHLEFTPIPRSLYESRLGFDPSGHQVNTMIETCARRIKSFPLNEDEKTSMQTVLDDIKRDLNVKQSLQTIKQHGKVALLVTQPPDWMTYEGAYDAVDIDNLIHAWAMALPEGWVGVPTYHPTYCASPDMEKALANACPRLHFLPSNVSVGKTEELLLEADGLVTISSSAAMTGLLFQKKVVVTGRAPYNTWCPREPVQLESAIPLTSDEALSTLAFLCHRYSFSESELEQHPEALMPMLNAMVRMKAREDWFFDKSDWSLARVQALFEMRRVEPKKRLSKRILDYTVRRCKKWLT